jgi:malate dehydrogenase (oxaloacetate-decarboxylating)
LTLLPPLTQVGDVADAVALAVARQAVDEGLAAQLDDEQIVETVEARKWRPQYRQATSQAG